ncbi:hypothetical protein [Paenibacillus donghaensis]|uniref:Uncharacterized protein n=1 Tax=Paenibacillus donghaensis TaxID=414771 RepID=A0A2Z2KDB0_9BACL|nr:hypothetical protein [Paenibacillus donghaensis]ASA20993.1 hypothetical protein B9T62_09460 [Paenibacillus donghaensis]
MSVTDRARLRKALKALRAQRVVLKERLVRINQNLCFAPIGSRPRAELLAARDSIRQALRLNAVAVRKIKRVLC